MAAARKPFKWRKWNNLLHRDIGYLSVGLTVVYAVSGVAVNHRADWNPSYDIVSETVALENVHELDPLHDEFADAILERLDLEGTVRGTFRRSPTDVDIFLEDATVSVDLAAATAAYERVGERPVLRETNFLHLNEPKKLWTYVADVYAVLLAFLAISGMFVLKGKKGIKGRGAWLTVAGMLVPIVFLLLYR
jgi:hypothetical protein